MQPITFQDALWTGAEYMTIPSASDRKESRWKLVISATVLFASGILYLSI
ncbi:hypothetical protein GV827_01815 [Sulfitobacter sp. JBTF-M27]|jgi:hypothetical protein|uniref:Uncharacterized protein n=1 Tax=Sulfitobacter sediminilitoris TaxID=2698830 RepID=A0A6P0C4R5_9RHOB|nr:hypothetical protein [Sulfitobacter sediminilitoris]NEK21141.1 hypothetical protein [Sulfitobacter sediminilitoris]